MSQDTYRTTVRELSDEIIDAQGPIRVLNAIKWDDQIRERFFESGFEEQPEVGPHYYESRPLGFDPSDLRDRFRALERNIRAQLGPVSPAGTLMRFMCEQFRLVIDMLEARGTPAFAELSGLLYGTPRDVFHVGGPTVLDLSDTLRSTLDAIAASMMEIEEPRTIPGSEAVRLLQQRLDRSMGPGRIDVRLDDGIVADAAAGASYIKMRADRDFSERDLAVLEAHEGWIHVGTTQNGLAQPVCSFLGKAAPRTTVTQEGLAVLTELLNIKSHPRRIQRIMRRVEGISLAADGAAFIDVFRSFREDGAADEEAWQLSSRIFRGCPPEAGPFTKDLGYSKGLVLTYVYVRMAIRLGRVQRIPMLFCGKVDLQDLGVLHQLYDEGLVDPPPFVPPPFDDLPSLASTLAFSRFQSQLDYDRLEADYIRII